MFFDVPTCTYGVNTHRFACLYFSFQYVFQLAELILDLVYFNLNQ